MTQELLARVDAAARVLDVSRSTIGRHALRAYLAALPEATRLAIDTEVQRSAERPLQPELPLAARVEGA